MDKTCKIGRFFCEFCSANPWIEIKNDLTRCEYCQVPFLVNYHVKDIISVSQKEVEKLKEMKLFYDIPDISACSDKYNVTYFYCKNCKKGHLVDPSKEIIICEYCKDAYKTSDVISELDKKYAEEIKRLKSQASAATPSNSIRNIKQAQRIEKQLTVSTPKTEDDKRNGLFSKLFKK